VFLALRIALSATVLVGGVAASDEHHKYCIVGAGCAGAVRSPVRPSSRICHTATDNRLSFIATFYSAQSGVRRDHRGVMDPS
jgi:hypothetical protein